MDYSPPPPAIVSEAPPSHSLEDVIRLWGLLRGIYPTLPDISASLQDINSPLANGGMTDDGRANIMVRRGIDDSKWDDDSRRVDWLRQMVAHEAGHSISSSLGAPGMSGYWQARGLPGTPQQQEANAWASVGNKPNPYQLIHEQLPEEMFAEDFAGLTNPTYKGGAETTFGIPYSRDVMDRFYRSPLPKPAPSPTLDIPGLAPGVNPFASLGQR